MVYGFEANKREQHLHFILVITVLQSYLLKPFISLVSQTSSSRQ